MRVGRMNPGGCGVNHGTGWAILVQQSEYQGGLAPSSHEVNQSRSLECEVFYEQSAYLSG
jgi:hypothetical protein